MCGIIGFNWKDKKLLKKSLKSIEHRGPDASGTFLDKAVSLGHRRLSIIDLSKAGRQPMSNEDKTIWIVFNGEIYNYKELKSELKTKHNFRSATDTEVLIHLYEEYGFDMVNKLDGMFAFCIYDSKKKILFIARDRVGIKPLYYYFSGKDLMFCSEIKGIITNQKIKREVNINALVSYLIFRANIEEETLFKGVKKLKPGHCMIYDLKEDFLEIKKYWELNKKDEKKSESDYVKKLKESLERSVKSQMMSDVPYGAYLSGGVDSGTIVSLMSKFSNKPIKTFSVGFKEADDNEMAEAREISKKLKTDHHELWIDKNAIKYLPEIIFHADEPMADPTAIPIYLLSKYAKKYCTVILTGEGSDELFAGYPQYKFMKLHKKFIRPFPKSLRKIGIKIFNILPSSLLDKGFKFSSALGEKGKERLKNFVLSDDYATQYLEQVSIFNEEEIKELLGKSIAYYNYKKEYFNSISDKNLIWNCELIDFKGNMVDDLLMKLDKNTMAFSVEGRVPFLNNEIIELSSKIPDNLKLKGMLNDKNILRKAVSDIVPKKTMERRKKHFFVPIDRWFKHELRDVAEKLLSEDNIKKQGIFNYEYINKIKDNFKNSKLFYSRQLWTLLVFQIWYKQFIENEKVKI